MGRIKEVVLDAEESMTVAFKKEQRMSLASCWVKRSFDIVGSIVGLTVLSPAFIVIGALVKREDKGPVLFRQERIGYKGKPFTLYKFRSMTATAESDGRPMLCQKHDKRLTRIGRFLREHHLDELPQLWNVLKGDMSFVGPRPERVFLLTGLFRSILTIGFYINYVRDCFQRQHSIMGIQIPWRKCWNGYAWIWNT